MGGKVEGRGLVRDLATEPCQGPLAVLAPPKKMQLIVFVHHIFKCPLATHKRAPSGPAWALTSLIWALTGLRWAITGLEWAPSGHEWALSGLGWNLNLRVGHMGPKTGHSRLAYLPCPSKPVKYVFSLNGGGEWLLYLAAA